MSVAEPEVIVRGGPSEAYPNVNLNGYTLVSKEPPPAHQPVILGYRVDHIPEIWFGVGYRDPSHVRGVPDRYWLGPRGRDPHYDGLSADDVILWRAFEKPFCTEDGRRGSSYLQWHWILGDPEEDAAFAEDEANAAYWTEQPAAAIELPWQPASGLQRSTGWPFAAPAAGPHSRRGYIVATGHPLGFGVNSGSYLPRDEYDRPILILDPKAIPDALWRDGSVPPERTVRGYHTSRFSIGEFDGWPQSDEREYAPLLSMHNGPTEDARMAWSPACGRGHSGGHGLRRWISFHDLWNSLPEAVRNEYRYDWRGMNRGYVRLESTAAAAPAAAQPA